MMEVVEKQNNSNTGLPIFLGGIALGAAVAAVLGHEEGRKVVEKAIEKLKDATEEYLAEVEKKQETPPESVTFHTPGLGPIWRVDNK